MGASSWFTRRLEAICDVFAVPTGLLSFLGALGANIPNYAAASFAIANSSLDVGLGIIIGSNIYNIAIILAIATFASRKAHGILLTAREAWDARIVAQYTLGIMFTTLLVTEVLPGTPLAGSLHTNFLLPLTCSVATLLIFALLVYSDVKNKDTGHASEAVATASSSELKEVVQVPTFVLLRWSGEGLLALLLSLAGVVVMVQAGQTLTKDLHMSAVLAGLLVLAVATSLPNTVVAFMFARAHRETACVEEIFCSNSINAALGIALPLLFFWHETLHNTLLLVLDAPFMVLLTLVALLCVVGRSINRLMGGGFLLVYVLWVVVHVLL